MKLCLSFEVNRGLRMKMAQVHYEELNLNYLLILQPSNQGTSEGLYR
jgi:hypothetical protein